MNRVKSFNCSKEPLRSYESWQLAKYFVIAAVLHATTIWSCCAATLQDGGKAEMKTRGAQGSLEIATPKDITQSIESPLEIQVIARNLPAEIVSDEFIVVDDLTGKRLFRPFVRSGQDKILQNQPGYLTFTPDKKAFEGVNSAKGSMILSYRVGADRKLTLTAPWNFAMTRPVPKVTVAATPKVIQRDIPFLRKRLDDKDVCLKSWITPQSLLDKLKQPIQGELEGTGDGAQPAKLSVTANVIGEYICLRTEIPGSYTQMKGKLWLRPPEVKEIADVDLDLRLKDHWGWRALAAILAVFPAMLLVYWTTTIRRRLLNRFERETVSARLHEFLSAHPDLANDAGVTFVRQFLLKSATEDKMGEFGASEQSLASARDRIESLFTSPPTAPVPVANSGQAIRIVTPRQRIIPAKKIVFVVGEPLPQWPMSGGMYRWTLTSPSGQAEATAQGVDLKEFEHVFKQPGSYQASVSVNNIDAPARSVPVLSSPKPSWVKQFRIVEIAMVVLTTALAAGTAFLTTESATTFGTFGDYFRLFASAFGVSGGTGSVATILASIRVR